MAGCCWDSERKGEISSQRRGFFALCLRQRAPPYCTDAANALEHQAPRARLDRFGSPGPVGPHAREDRDVRRPAIPHGRGAAHDARPAARERRRRRRRPPRRPRGLARGRGRAPARLTPGRRPGVHEARPPVSTVAGRATLSQTPLGRARADSARSRWSASAARVRTVGYHPPLPTPFSFIPCPPSLAATSSPRRPAPSAPPPWATASSSSPPRDRKSVV